MKTVKLMFLQYFLTYSKLVCGSTFKYINLIEFRNWCRSVNIDASNTEKSLGKAFTLLLKSLHAYSIFTPIQTLLPTAGLYQVWEDIHMPDYLGQVLVKGENMVTHYYS